MWVNRRRGELYEHVPGSVGWRRAVVNTDAFTVVDFFFRGDTLVVAERHGDDGRLRRLVKTGAAWVETWRTPTPKVQEVQPRGPLGLWAVTRDGVYAIGSTEHRRVTTPDQIPWWYSESSADTSGGLLVGFGDGVRRFGREGQLESYIRRSEFAGGLPLKQMADDEGGVWIAHTQGLAHLEQDYLVAYPIEDTPEGIVKDLAVGPRGAIWAAAWEGMYRLKEDRFVRVSPVYASGSHPATRPLIGNAGAVTWGEPEGGTFRWINGRLSRYAASVGVPILVTAEGDRVVVDARGTWWVSATGQRVHLSDDVSLERAAVEGKDGVVWITNKGQLDVVVGTVSGRAHPERLSPSLRATLQALESASVGELHLDAYGRIWLAAFNESKGLWCIYQTTDGVWAWKQWQGTEDGLLADVSSIFPTPDGRLWIGTWRGLQEARIVEGPEGIPALQMIRQFRGRDGLAGEQVEAVAEDEAGRVWIASAAGRVFRLDRGRVPELASPGVLLSRLTVDDRDVAPQARPITISYGQSRLAVDIAPLTYRQLHAVSYEYRLVPYDTTWAPLGEGRSLRIPVLPVGTQTLEVRAIRVGTAPGPITRQAFVVRPPFYRQWWFSFVIAGLAFLPVGLWYRIRLDRQLAAERLRLRIATDLHDDLGGGLTQVSLYSELIRRQAPEPAATWAGEVGETARALTDTMRDIVWSFSASEETFAALAARMRAHAARLCEPLGLHLDFEAAASDPDTVLSVDVRRNVLLVFKEIVHNTAKHAGGTHLDVALHLSGHTLDLRVADDGRGFDVATADGGHGLRNLRRRAAEVGGTLLLTSAVGRGTAVEFSIPRTGGSEKRLWQRLPDGWARRARPQA